MASDDLKVTVTVKVAEHQQSYGRDFFTQMVYANPGSGDYGVSDAESALAAIRRISADDISRAVYDLSMVDPAKVTVEVEAKDGGGEVTKAVWKGKGG